MGTWTAYILGVEGPARARPTGWEIIPSWGLLLVMAICLSLFVFLIYRLYSKESVRIPARLRTSLVGLRTLAALALGLLIFQPFSCSIKLEGTRQRPVALILDDSASMTQKDSRTAREDLIRAYTILGKNPPDESAGNLVQAAEDLPTRLELGKKALDSILEDWSRENPSIVPPRRYLMGLDLKRIHDNTPRESLMEMWKGEQSRTTLAASIDRLLSMPEELPSAMVVLTDGRETGPGPSLDAVAKTAASRGVPLIFLGLGLEQHALVELRDMLSPDLIQAGETVAIPIRWRAGYFDLEKHPGAKVELKLELDGNEVARESIPAKPGEDLRHVLLFKPDATSAGKKGSQLTATIRMTGLGETPSDKLSRPVQVIDRKIKLLIVDKSPRWDMRFLLMNLTREQVATGEKGAAPRAALDPAFVILEGDTGLTGNQPFLPEFPATRKDLFAFDAVILGDVPVDKLGPEGAERLRQFVEEGGGLLIPGGRKHNGTGWVNTPLGDLLPFEPATIEATPTDARTTGFLPQLTLEGTRHDALRLADTPEASERVWKGLPGLHWFSPVKKVKPGATILLAHPTSRTANGPAPLLVTQPYGRGQVAYFGFDEAWRWRYNEGETHFGRFWSQWIYWAAGSKAGAIRQTRLSVDRPDPTLGTLGQITGRILDRNFQPERRDKIPARLEWLDAPENLTLSQKTKDVFLRALPDHPGEYTLPLSHDRVGRFALVVPGETETRVEWRTFPPHDMEKGGLAAEALRDAARVSGGAYLREDEGKKVHGLLKPAEAPVVVRAEMPRLHPFLFLVLAVALSLEWTLRRWNNMS